jgi:hypothetical protein
MEYLASYLILNNFNLSRIDSYQFETANDKCAKQLANDYKKEIGRSKLVKSVNLLSLLEVRLVL